MTTAAAQLQIKRGFVYSPHGNIEYREAGTGPPLVFLHPTPSSSVAYQSFFHYFTDQYRCIGMSTMGYGQSDTPPYPYATLHEFAQCVIWLLDGLGIEKTNLYGGLTGR